jgi:DMSO/TMAO reductase YedYZ heme-binding membrane subunit
MIVCQVSAVAFLALSAIALVVIIIIVTAGIRAVRLGMGSFEGRKLSARAVDSWLLSSFGHYCVTLRALRRRIAIYTQVFVLVGRVWSGSS